MAVTDLWRRRDGSPTKRAGVGLQWRVTVPGHPSKSFRTKGAAKAHELTLLSRGPVRPQSETTVGEMLDSWQPGKAHLSAGGRAAVAAGVGHARRRWGDSLVGDVYTHEVQAWISNLTYDRDGESRPASRDLKSKSLSALRGALDIACRTGAIGTNPCLGVKVGRAQRRDPRFLTAAQLLDLERHAAKVAAGPRGGPMLYLLGMTGLRVGECCALDVGDVDARRRRLRVRKSKTGRARDVPVPASVLARLDLKRPSSEPLFVSKTGGRVAVRSWRRWVFEPAASAAGLHGVHVHDLRHTAASLMIRSGATPKDVQNALGHASAAMTLDLYAGWWDDTLDDVAARMDALLASEQSPAVAG